MLDDLFLIKLLLSFVAGGLWVGAATLFAERFGSRVGGIIASLPSTAVVGFLFIGWSQSAQFAAEGTTVFPAAEGVTGLFLVLMIALLPRGLAFASVASFAVWFILQGVLYIANLESLLLSFAILLVLFIPPYYYLEKHTPIRATGSKKVRYTPGKILFRMVFAGGVVVLTVVAAAVGGPAAGGIFSAFPAAFFSVTYLLVREHGPTFGASVGKTMFFSGVLTVVIFAMGVRIFFPLFGIWVGAALAFILSLVAAVLIYWFAQRFMK